MAGRTPRFGWNWFGGTQGGSIGEDQGKFTGLDRLVQDSVIAALEGHDHTYQPTFADPSGSPVLDLDVNGALPGGRTFYYSITFTDQYGLETVAGPEVSVAMPGVLSRPAAPSVASQVAGALAPSLYFYAVTALRGVEQSVLGSPISIRLLSGQAGVVVTLPPLGTADSYRVWRQGSGESYFTAIGISATGTFVDDGSVPADPCACEPANQPPSFNSGISNNSVVVTLSDADKAVIAAGNVRSWRLYRTEQAGVYSANSLVHDVVELIDEADPLSGLLVSWEDVGDQLSTGAPPLVSQRLALKEYVIPGAATLPDPVGYPENYPLIVDGQLYVIDEGFWVQPIGSPGGGGNGGLVEGTTTVIVGTGITEVNAADINNSVFVGATQAFLPELDGGGGYGGTLLGAGAKALRSTLLSGGGSSDYEQTAVGWFAAAADQGVAVGAEAFASKLGTAVGDAAYANSPHDVALGASAGSDTYAENLATFLSNSGSVTYGTAGDGTVPTVSPVNGGTSYGVIVVFKNSLGKALHYMTKTIVTGSFTDPATASFAVDASISQTVLNTLTGGIVEFWLPDENVAPHPSSTAFRGTYLGDATPALSNTLTVTSYVKGTQDVTLFDQNISVEKRGTAVGADTFVGPAAVEGTALGTFAAVYHPEATAVGTGAESLRANEVVLGRSSETVRVPGGRVELTASRMAVGLTEAGNPIVRDLDAATTLRVSERVFWPYKGAVAVESLDQRYYNDFGEAATILTARVSAGVAPTGAALVVDVKVDGVVVDTFTVADGASTVLETGLAIAVPAGSYVTAAVTQVGSTTPGSDLSLQLGLGF